MKLSMYFNYTSRSLLRGGQRTILAIFCVAVGVMSIVALQLAGFMLQHSLDANTRDVNGGDLRVTALSVPLTQSDLSYFSQLKSNGTITNYAAITSNNGFLSATASSFKGFTISAIDPTHYPLVTPPRFVTPDNGALANSLINDQVVVSQTFVDTFHKNVGDLFNVYVKSVVGSGQTLQVKIVGVVANEGIFAQSSSVMLISSADYYATFTNATVSYTRVDVTTANLAHTNSAQQAISKHFAFVTTQTVADARKAVQSSLDSIDKFLEIAGLLALLIGGVGIINTMRVLLARRKTEIAMLKTSGYRRMDLYALFGMEAGLLGLIGGIIGAIAAIGVSYIVCLFMKNLGTPVSFVLDALTIVGGILIGLVTSLIFGLMPIVQAANIRPLNVIRDIPESKGFGRFATTIFLLILLSILFCAFAIVILNNDVVLGIEAVYGTFAFLLLLSGIFGLIVLLVSKLPVPEHFNLKQFALTLCGIVVAVLLSLILPVFGALLGLIALFGIVIVLLPRSWKVSTKMALRNIGRTRTRTTTTALALFIGVFTIGLVVTLGQDLQSLLSVAFTQNLPYNVLVTTTGTDTTTVQQQLGTIPGLSKSNQDEFAQVIPAMINGKPIQSSLPTGYYRQVALAYMNTMEGYNLAHTVPGIIVTQGRNLNASDVGTNNILLHAQLTNAGIDASVIHMHLKLGDALTFASIDGKVSKTLKVVGIYTGDTGHSGNVLTANSTVNALSTHGVATITYMNINTARVNDALNTLGRIVPNATVQNVADIGAFYAQQLNGLIDMLVAIASLSVIASVIIIANAVALAMLERRRELGILKSVGYTSRVILREVMIENGVTSIVSAFMAMLLAVGAVFLLGKLVFNLTFPIPSLLVLVLIVGPILLAVVTAMLVAGSVARIRPLEVLRYE